MNSKMIKKSVFLPPPHILANIILKSINLRTQITIQAQLEKERELKFRAEADKCIYCQQ